VGGIATVKEALKPKGTISFKGELWTAIIEQGQAKPGEEVIITKSEGLILHVRKK
jgi:membrane protein implicated in regulation of membrane protease activity